MSAIEKCVTIKEEMSIEIKVECPKGVSQQDEKVRKSVKKRALESSDTDGEGEAKKTRRLTPLKLSDEAWTKVEVSVNWVQKITFNNLILPPLSLIIKPKISKESWTQISDLDLGELKTVGEIEKIVVRILDQEMTESQEKKEEVHNKLKESLKIYANDGIFDAIPSLLELMKTT